jgi:hypothetical protein
MYMDKELPTLRGFTYETAAEHVYTRVPVASLTGTPYTKTRF